MNFNSLGLSADILRAVQEQGFTTPTPIQHRAIPTVLEGHDIMAQAQTGTGKTAAFALPILQRVYLEKSTSRKRDTTVLVLTPTRELAAQVGAVFNSCGRPLGVTSSVIFGGVNMGAQQRELANGVDIIVATPGRLLDHLGRGTVNLSSIRILTLDEADRMLDMGFIHDIRRLLALMPPSDSRQNLMFSATFSNDIAALAKQMLNSPKRVTIGVKNAAADRVTQQVLLVAKSEKRHALIDMIRDGQWRQVLVFTRTKHGADRLVKQLAKEHLSAAAIHGNKSQGARTRALHEFKSGKTRVLVATDIAARGIDIDQLSHVVNFELPNVPEDYVHRIGRTARAGHSGMAISLVEPDEEKQLRAIEGLLKRKIERLNRSDRRNAEQPEETPITNHMRKRSVTTTEQPSHVEPRATTGSRYRRRNGTTRRITQVAALG